jgi:hypothetical protein
MKLCYWVRGSQHFEDPVFLLNIWTHLSNHTVTYPRRPKSSSSMTTHCLTLTASSSHPHDERASELEVNERV